MYESNKERFKARTGQVSRGRHIDVLSSRRSKFICNGVSLPFCLYRNQSRYECLLTNALVGYKDDWGNVITSRKEEYFRDLAPYRQALTFTRSPDPEEFPFAVRALHNTLHSENYENGRDILHRKASDTITDCQHYDTSLVIHVGGKYMDTLVLRETRLCRPGLQTGVPGFTLSLGKGECIVQVVCVSTARWHVCSHILARTHNQLYHVRTVSLSDEMPKTSQKYDVLGRATIILEPLQQWEFPSNIIDLSVHPSRGVGVAFMTCRDGSLYSWSAAEGVKEVYRDLEYHEAEWLSLCCSNHPMFCFKSRGSKLYGVDIRSTSENIIFADSNNFTALCHHGHSPHHLFTCNASSSVGILDIRYPKRYLFQKFIGEVATNMKFFSTVGIEMGHTNQTHLACTMEDPLNAIVSTRCGRSQKILLHSFQFGTSHLDEKEMHPSALYAATQPFEMKHSSINSESSSFPVIDRCQPFTNNIGALLMACTGGYDDELKQNKKNFYNAILLQQSSIGDVHAQRIDVKIKEEKLWEYGIEIAHSEHPLQHSSTNNILVNKRIEMDKEYNAPLKYRKKARKEPTHSYCLYQGLTLKNNILDIDLDTTSFPISSADVITSLDDLREGDYHVVRANQEDEDGVRVDKKRLDFIGLKKLLEEELSSLFGDESSCTLWEIVRALERLHNATCDLNELRSLLSTSEKLGEFLLPPMRTVQTFDDAYSSYVPFIAVSGKGKQALKELEKNRREVFGDDNLPKIPQCHCVDAVPGVCDLGENCLRLHRYVYERKDEFTYGHAFRQRNIAFDSSSASSSSGETASAPPSTIKIGDEIIDVNTIISRLEEQWEENEKKLNMLG